MQQILKYQIQLGLKKNFEEELKIWSLDMPQDSKILSVQSQFGQPVLWALVDTENNEITRSFRIFSTGEEITEMSGAYWEHVGSLQIEGGRWTWHVMELRTDERIIR